VFDNTSDKTTKALVAIGPVLRPNYFGSRERKVEMLAYLNELILSLILILVEIGHGIGKMERKLVVG